MTATPRTDAEGSPIWSARVRPFSIPDNLDDLRGRKETGRITLPLHVYWSGPLRAFNLDDRTERIRVYPRVLREGTLDDLKRYIDLDELIDLWPDLVLPAHIRAAWAEKIHEQLGVDL